MPPPPVPRTPPDPHLFCLLHTGNPGDADFYLRLCADADTVLEVGCGDGRLLAPLAAQGNTAVGIEPAAAVRRLAMQRKKKLPAEVSARFEVLDADMRTLKLGRKFDRILVPYCGMYCLRDDEEVVQALKALAAHLAPGGLLAFDGYAVHDPEGMEGYGEFDHLTTLKDGKATVDVYERDDHDVANHVVNVTYFHEIKAPGARMKTHSYTLRHHYLVCDRVPDLLEEAGLSLVSRFADFEGGEFDEDAEHQVVLAGLTADLLAEGDDEDFDGEDEGFEDDDGAFEDDDAGAGDDDAPLEPDAEGNYPGMEED